MKRLDWYIARRYLASRRRGRFLSLITLIAVGGVGLGVTALITVIAVMTGLQRDLQQKILGNNPHVYVFERARGFRLGNWRALVPRIQAVKGVVAAQPFIMTQVGIIAGGNYMQFGELYGVDTTETGPPLTDIEKELRAHKVAFGPTQSGLPGIILGSKLADKLSVVPGDTVVIAGGENIKTGPDGSLVPTLRPFEVTAFNTTGMYEYDTQYMYANMAAVQDLLGMPADTVSGIAVDVTDPWHAKAEADAIYFELGYPYWVDNWISLNQSLFSALKLEKIAMAVILFLIVVVAAFNIISTLIMVVTDKTREIGILKSMGMTDRGILRVFMLQGLTIGLIGTVLGALGGLVLVGLLARYKFITLPGDVYFIETLPVALEPLDFSLIVVLSILIAFAATIYPARQASRLLPVEAIRHE